MAHLCIQFIIWMAFYFAYNITRGLADRNVSLAFENGEAIARAEERLGLLFEPALQGLVVHPLMVFLTTWSYWLSQFVIVGVALAWVYLRRHERFAFFRNWLIVANVTGLVCYVLFPTAPPRMLPRWGFTDMLAEHHDSVSSLANQYAAMPSLHAMDALVVAAAMFGAVRSRTAKTLWLAWPAWIIFIVLATSNHYWLDIVAGIAIALAAAAVVRSHGRADKSRHEPVPEAVSRDLAEADSSPARAMRARTLWPLRLSDQPPFRNGHWPGSRRRRRLLKRLAAHSACELAANSGAEPVLRPSGGLERL